MEQLLISYPWLVPTLSLIACVVFYFFYPALLKRAKESETTLDDKILTYLKQRADNFTLGLFKKKGRL